MREPNFFIIGAKILFSPMIADLYHKREMKRLEELYGRYLKLFASTTLPIAALILLRIIDVSSPAFTLLLTLTISSCVFWGTLLLLGLDNEDREFISLIRNRLR